MKNNSKKSSFSVIIPNRDGVEELRETIEGVIADQTFLKEDYEIIVANDGGFEEVEKLIYNYRDNNISVKSLVINESKGSYYARNRAIEISVGYWFIFLDSGLRMSPGWFYQVKKYLGAYSYIAGDVRMEKLSKMTLGQQMDYVRGFPIKEYLEKNHYGGIGYLLVARDVFDKVGLLNEQLFSGGDGEFGVRVYEAGFKQVFFDDAPAFHQPRTFKMQLQKRKRIFKGHYDVQRLKNLSGNSFVFKSYWRIILGFLRDLLKDYIYYRKNKFYVSGQFNLVEYYYVITAHHVINLLARFYVKRNKDKVINT